MLINELVNAGTYRVIERNQIDKILNEQNFSNSNRADSASAAKIGHILGVDAVITGDITQFGRDDQNKNVGGMLGKWGSGYGLGGVGTSKSKAVVAITARMIDTSSGEILASASGKGESSRSGTMLGGGGAGTGGFGAGGGGMTSSNFAATIIGEATDEGGNRAGVESERGQRQAADDCRACCAHSYGQWAGCGCVVAGDHHQTSAADRA